MVKLVSLDQAKAHLRVDNNDGDSDLEFKIEAASEAVINYLKSDATFVDTDGEVPQDSSGEPVGVPRVVQQATLYLIGVMDRDRDGQDGAAKNSSNPSETWEKGYLPRPVISLLYPLRKPACE